MPLTPEEAMRLEPVHIQDLNDKVKVHDSHLTALKAFALAVNPLNPATWLIYALSVAVTAIFVVPKDKHGQYQWQKASSYALLPFFVVAMFLSYTAVTHNVPGDL